MTGLRLHRKLTKMLLPIIAIATVSCHSHHSGNGKPYNKKHNHSSLVDSNWKNLNIALSRKDNAKLFKVAKSWLGVPYRYGGKSQNGTDCSGFVGELYKTVYDTTLERNSAKIFEKNCKEIDKEDLRQGDLLFFGTNKHSGSKINHVGIYLKENKFIHASSSRGVVVSDINEKYYIEHFLKAGRVKK